MSAVARPGAEAVVAVGKHLISFEETRDILDYAFAALTINDNDWRTWLAPLGYDHVAPARFAAVMPEGVQARDFCIFCPETGLKLALFIKGEQIMITFGALNATASEVPVGERRTYLRGTIWSAISNLASRKPIIFDRAVDLIRRLQAHDFCAGREIILTGQSFGGGVSSYVALVTDLKAYCFNSLPLGAWVEAEVGAERRELAARKITQLTVLGDWLSDTTVPAVVGLFSRIHVPGRRVYMASAYPRSAIDTHTLLVGSMLCSLGFEDSARPSDILPRLRGDRA